LETTIAAAPASSAARAASPVRMPFAIHGRPCRAVASASRRQSQAGTSSLNSGPNVSATDGVPSPATFPENTLMSGLNLFIRLRARNPGNVQSTVTQRAS